MEKEKQLLIGCSGYYYPQWKGTFYPSKLSPSKWLEHYSAVFNTVEFNGSFYRVPKLADMKKQYENTPPGFKFSVKVNRHITHILRLKNTAEEIRQFRELVEEGFADKLHKLLFQMPPSFQYSEENLEQIVTNIPKGSQNVIELRDHSWWNNGQVEKVFKEMGYIFCNVDYPGLQDKFISTSNEFYLRLHGTPDLFKSAYTNEQLEQFYRQIPPNDSCTIYFNNTYYNAGHENALKMMRIAGI